MLTLEFTKQATCEEICCHFFCFILLGVLHTASFPFSKFDMFRYSPLSSKGH